MKTSRTLAVVLAILTLTATAEAKKRSPLVEELTRAFEGQCLVSKAMLGNSVEYRSRRNNELVHRIVDTEIYPDGDLRYHARAGYYSNPLGHEARFLTSGAKPILGIGLLDRGEQLEPERLTVTLPPGTRLCIYEVDAKKDRLELSMRGPHDEHARLKLMLGKRFEKTQTFDEIMLLAARVLQIDRYERLLALQTRSEGLIQAVESARRAYEAPGATVPQKLEAAHSLISALRDSADVREKISSLSEAPLDEAPDYLAQAADIADSLPALEDAAREERLLEIRHALSANVSACAAARARAVGGAGVPASERATALDRYERLLGERSALHDELAGMGESVTASDRAALRREEEEAKRLRTGIERKRQASVRAELDETYARLKRRRGELQASYAGAFGTPRQASEAENLISCLRQMHENRLAAQKQGSSKAGSQAKALESEIERIRRQQR